MKNIVVCCDGTSSEFGLENTNVVRIAQCLRKDAPHVTYYDPGVGTMPSPRFMTRIGQKTSQAIDLAIGTGMLGNVTEAYTFLMEQYERGDKIFLFGFSRGAYTVRVLAALLHQMGLLPRGAMREISTRVCS